VSWLERLIETPEGIATLKRWFYVSLAVIVVLEIALPYLMHDEHTYFAFEHFPAWGSIYGLISCVLIIVVSKWIGKMLLERGEDYYDR
jgi:hypothetical protein